MVDGVRMEKLIVTSQLQPEPPDVRLWFDPVCPWCWVTYRWLREVERHGRVSVTLSLMSLAFLNEHRPGVPDRYKAPHARSLLLGRVVAAASDTHGSHVLAPMYDSVGKYLHEDNGKDFTAAAAAALDAAGLDSALSGVANDDGFDRQLRALTQSMVTKSGADVGTPVIEIGGQAMFGPVLSRVPLGDSAVDLFDAVTTLAAYPHFFELKKPRDEEPECEKRQ